jgi:hypothetical protein
MRTGRLNRASPPETGDHGEVGERPRYTARTGIALVAAVAVTGVAGYLISRVGAPEVVPGPPPIAAPHPHAVFPPSTSGYSVADDAATNQVLMFGGIAGLQATWLWNGRSWTLAQPQTSPIGRIDAAMAYDPALRVVLMFGGHGFPGTDLTDTWEWNGVTWRELDKGTSVGPASDASMVWDPAINAMVLVASTTWTWSGTQWTSRGNVLPYLPPDVVAGYDPSTHLLMAVVAPDPTGPAVGDRVQTWAWNGSDWRQVRAPNLPVAYSLFGLGWDPSSDSLLLFSFATGGSQSADAWAWNGATWLAYSKGGLPILDGAIVSTSTSLLLVGALMTGTTVPETVRVWVGTSGSWEAS